MHILSHCPWKADSERLVLWKFTGSVLEKTTCNEGWQLPSARKSPEEALSCDLSAANMQGDWGIETSVPKVGNQAAQHGTHCNKRRNNEWILSLLPKLMLKHLESFGHIQYNPHSPFHEALSSHFNNIVRKNTYNLKNISILEVFKSVFISPVVLAHFYHLISW